MILTLYGINVLNAETNIAVATRTKVTPTPIAIALLTLLLIAKAEHIPKHAEKTG